MKTKLETTPRQLPENVIDLTIAPRSRPNRHRQRFAIQDFANATGTKSYRVTGYKRDGERVRENFAEMKAAQCRQLELETEYLRGEAETTIRATKLSAEQVQLAEVAFIKLGDDWQRILDAVDHWLTHGRQTAVADSPRLDDGFKAFCDWLGSNGCTLRVLSRQNLRWAVNVFINSVANMRVADVTPDTIDAYLDKRAVSPRTKDNNRRALSRFFSWCIERPRRWAAMNPCREVKVQQGDNAPPAILTVKECEALLRVAEAAGFAPYVAVCLFGGLRPFEARRLEWKAVNLADLEIRLEANQTKTRMPRVVAICDTLAAWLKAYHGQPFFTRNWRDEFRRARAVAGLKKWPVDVMRHTAISHYFRHTGSYGRTAEWAGNSESIIKGHYQGRVTSEETKKFYALRPAKGGAK